MAVIGTFGSFTAARLGIYVSQASLNVTGNNISNINTKGYTRQRADLVSLHSAGSARIASSFNLDIGYGVLVDTVSQLRDPFLDIRYRDEQASVGFYEAQLKGLQQISNVLDETTAVLTPQETKELFVQLKKLREKGFSIVFISHKLGEIKEICDRITVLRLGRYEGTVDVKDVSEADISRMMVGRDV